MRCEACSVCMVHAAPAARRLHPACLAGVVRKIIIDGVMLIITVNNR